MAKQAITQRNFSLGEMRENLLEADDLELRSMSCRRARNVRITDTGTMVARDGTFWVRDAEGARSITEIRPNTSDVFAIIVGDDFLLVLDESGAAVHEVISAPWTDGSLVWVEPFREFTIIGHAGGLHQLVYSGGAWSFAPFQFATAPNGAIAQPYWVFQSGITMRPSARSGAISLTASSAIFTSQYIGQRIRYGGKEIAITAVASATSASGTVISTLPPSYQIKVADAQGFQVGDAVIGADSDFQGVVTRTAADNTIFLVAYLSDSAPEVGEKITGPRKVSTISTVAEVPPEASTIWDEPLISPARGYPESAVSAAGRFFFTNFPLVRDLIVASSVRGIFDFEVGVEDDDAIVRQVGDNMPHFRHIVNAGDLILLSDRGIYYVSLREGSALTPNNFNAIMFDRRSASGVRPVAVGNGVVFVEAGGKSIAACVEIGNVYLKWSVQGISALASHLVRQPFMLCGVSDFSTISEKYLFSVNSDGTLASLSWSENFSLERVGFTLWETQGEFLCIAPAFGGYWAITERQINGVNKRFIERFSEGATLDASRVALAQQVLSVNGDDLSVNGQGLEVVGTSLSDLSGQTVRIVDGGFDYGNVAISLTGEIQADVAGEFVVGFNFVASVMPWPAEVINSARAGMLKARLIQGAVSVLGTNQITIRANNSERRVLGYAFGDDLSVPPPARTKVCKFPVLGRRDHPEIEIRKDVPGAFELLAITQEVQV